MSVKFKIDEDYVENSLMIAKVEEVLEYRKWSKEIPYIPFPDDWEIQMIPPFGGAIVRFCIRRKGGKKSISVYLDCYGKLGAVDQPYWEIYPYKEDTYRCYMNEVEDLINAIEHELGNKRRFLTKS